MMLLLRYRAPKIVRHAVSDHTNDYDLENQSRGRDHQVAPVLDCSYRDWNQRTVIVEHVLQRSLGRNKNLTVDSSERSNALSPLLFNAAVDAQWIYGAH